MKSNLKSRFWGESPTSIESEVTMVEAIEDEELELGFQGKLKQANAKSRKSQKETLCKIQSHYDWKQGDWKLKQSSTMEEWWVKKPMKKIELTRLWLHIEKRNPMMKNALGNFIDWPIMVFIYIIWK